MKIKNLLAYFNERFPIINMGLFTLLFFTVRAVVFYFTNASQNQSLAWHALGVIAVISFFFRLRVFDEIKDFKQDSINYPNRVLQSGRITLKNLSRLAIIGTVIELAWCLWTGYIAILFWSVAVAYSLFMRYEFFVGAFLKKHLLIYALTHMLVMPLIILWIFAAFYPALESLHPFYMLAGLSLLSGFSFEIARKIHAPAAEKASIDSYSKAIGFKKAVILLLTILALGVLLQVFILIQVDARFWAYSVIALIYIFALLLYLKNLHNPEERSLRSTEKVVSLFMLLSYLSIVIEIYSKDL